MRAFRMLTQSGLSHRHVSLHAMAPEPLETFQRDEIIFELNISCAPPPVPTCRIGPAPTSCVKGAWIEQAKPALERPSGRTAASRRDRARPIGAQKMGTDDGPVSAG